jgi:hypothetical protein
MKTKKIKNPTRSIFWGTIFISFGIGVLLQQNHIVDFSDLYLNNVWSVLLILIGIAFLNIPTSAKMICSGLSALVISTLILSFTANFWSDMHSLNFGYHRSRIDNIHGKTIDRQSVSLDKLKDSANLVIKGGAIDLDIFDSESATLELSGGENAFKIDYDSLYRNYEITSLGLNNDAESGQTSELKLSDKSRWNLNVDLGAANLNGDFSNLNIGKLYMHSGASDIQLKLGNKSKYTEIVIEAGASSVELDIPRDAYCEVYTNSHISDNNFEGFTEVNSGFYKTNNSNSTNNVIIITISGAISDCNINRY